MLCVANHESVMSSEYIYIYLSGDIKIICEVLDVIMHGLFRNQSLIDVSLK